MSMNTSIMTADEVLDSQNEPTVWIDLSQKASWLQAHVPAARNLAYSDLVRNQPPVMGLVPRMDALERLMQHLGIEAGQRVLAYDDSSGTQAARLVWTLHYLGHDRAAMMLGGLSAWLTAGGRVVSGQGDASTGSAFVARPCPDVLADAAWIQQHLDDPEVRILDVRRPAEYRGEDLRGVRGGHIPGALNYEWIHALDAEMQGHQLRSRPALMAELQKLGITPDKEVVVHCHSHQRSSLFYCVLRQLGFERVRGYPGSWSDWGQRFPA